VRGHKVEKLALESALHRWDVRKPQTYPTKKGHNMSTYSELMAQAQALMAQAEQARKGEMSEAIADIKAKMKQFGITVADLGGVAGSVKKAAKTKSTAPAKYRGPNGELWAGGPGRKPEWVRTVLASGQSIDEYLI
jgi:DNA-binding protein H-NS